MTTERGVPATFVEHFFGACHGDDLLEYFRDCGARWKRGGTGWHVQEATRGEYDFSDWDALTETATAEGVRLMPVFNYTASWASTAPEEATDPHRYAMREDAVDDWRTYVEAFVERYPDCTHFEIWNEPNIGFLKVEDDEQRHEVYVDRLLKPAAEVLHAHGKKVVAPSITTESWGWNVDENIERIDEWLSYRDAWRDVDYLSVHYIKGDTEKLEVEGAENLLPFYEYVHDEYVSEGKLDGIWNTEEGFTAVEAGDSGFVALEPWERKPYPQWVPRYTVPVIHWAIEHGWDHTHQYKVFWYRMGTRTNSGTLDACNLLVERDGEIELSERGHTLRTLVDTFTEPERIDAFEGEATVGFGLVPTGTVENVRSPYEFTSYAFRFDDDVFVATWLDLPGIDLTYDDRPTIQAVVEGLDPDADLDISVVDYRTGERTTVDDYEWSGDDLHVRIPRTPDPVLYTRIST